MKESVKRIRRFLSRPNRRLIKSVRTCRLTSNPSRHRQLPLQACWYSCRRLAPDQVFRRRGHQASRAVAGLFSAARDDSAKLTARMLDENKELHRSVKALEEIAATSEAEALLRDSSSILRDGAI